MWRGPYWFDVENYKRLIVDGNVNGVYLWYYFGHLHRVGKATSKNISIRMREHYLGRVSGTNNIYDCDGTAIVSVWGRVGKQLSQTKLGRKGKTKQQLRSAANVYNIPLENIFEYGRYEKEVLRKGYDYLNKLEIWFAETANASKAIALEEHLIYNYGSQLQENHTPGRNHSLPITLPTRQFSYLKEFRPLPPYF